MDHIKDQIVVEADEDTSLFTSFVSLPSRTNKRGVSDSTVIGYRLFLDSRKGPAGGLYIHNEYKSGQNIAFEEASGLVCS